MPLPQRKRQRLQNYDYSQNGAYFLTLCTQDKACLFGRVRQGKMYLNDAGKMVEHHLLKLQEKDGISIERYVIMPNHIHILLLLERPLQNGTTPRSFPTISALMQGFKSVTTTAYIQNVQAGHYPPFEKRIWQKSFYDHIVRDEEDFLQIWAYITYNALKWQQDKFYIRFEKDCE